MLELYRRIRQRREELDMSQDELAKKLGYKSRSSINKIEKGENDIPQSKIVAFAEALNTSPEYLMGWDSDDKNNEETRLLDGYRELDAGGRKVIMDMIGQLNFGNRAVRKVARSSAVALSSEVERPAAVARPLRLSRSAPRIHFNNVRPEGNVPSAVVKAIGGLDSVKKITGVEVNEVKAVGVLTKTVGVGKGMTVDKPVISARSFKDD